MDPADFVAKYPTVLHLADVRSWPSIERHGLLSAAEIVRRWQVPPDRAEALLTRERLSQSCSTTLSLEWRSCATSTRFASTFWHPR